MTTEELLLRQSVVAGSGLVYWAGVLVQARRVRQQIGRSPNLKPRGTKEKVLWLGWLLVIAAWIGLPWVAGTGETATLFRLGSTLLYPAGLVTGLVLVAAGYVGTLWCYAIMGSAWRIGVNQAEKNALVTTGPFGRVRHPIYAFQIVMLAGAVCLLPNAAFAALLAFHLFCVWQKASDEEAYLLIVHGEDYRAYCARAGRLFPKFG